MSNLTEAIRQAYATSPTNEIVLETLQIHHPLVGEDQFLVQDLVDHDMTLEDATVKTFRACAFRMALPTSGEKGIQNLSLAIDNTDRAISDFIEIVKDSTIKTEITYRPYLSTDLTTPQMVPPLVLYLSDIVETVSEVTATASFGDIINQKFPTALYTRRRFPSLGNL